MQSLGGLLMHAGFWSRHCVAQQLPSAPLLSAGNAAATSPASPGLGQVASAALGVLRSTAGVLHTHNEPSGAILDQSIQLLNQGVKLCRNLSFSSSILPKAGPAHKARLLGSQNRWRVGHKQQELVFTKEDA